jgi:hypothetical protein
MRFQRVIGNDAGEPESQPFVEAGGALILGGIEYQQPPAARDGQALGLAQQRCGWFGGRPSSSVTVPISASPSKAPRTIRSPRAAAASEFSQNALAASGASGCMKLTEPPLATVSISTSLNAAQIVGECNSLSILIGGVMLAPRKGHDISAGDVGLVGERHLGRGTKSQAIAGIELVTDTALGDDKRARQHPENLTDVDVGSSG